MASAGPESYPKSIPPRAANQGWPAAEHKLTPEPQYMATWYKGTGKLQDKVAIITGGDSGIGRSVAVLFAREGANVVICYNSNTEDAEKTKGLVEKEGRQAFTIQADIGIKHNCNKIIEQTVAKFGKIDILVNNAAEQHVKEDIREITEEQLVKTFRTNIFSMFFLSQAAIDHMKPGSSIINTTSVTAFRGKASLLDYSSTKGAIATFTRSLAQQLSEKGIRVNGVAPGPIWTPLVAGTFDQEQLKEFGKSTLMKRPGQPEECATCYVFLASRDASYITGQILHPNGGTPVGQ